MKAKLIKVVSLLFAMSLLIISSGLSVSAVGTLADVALAASDNGKVVLDGENPGSVTISIVCEQDLVCYGIEGMFGTTEEGSTTYFTLTDLAINNSLPADELDDFADVESGLVSWLDDGFENGDMTEGFEIVTATYAVDKNTPAGEYTISFVGYVFTGEDGNPDETETILTTTITVEEAEEGLKGDVNLDGEITLADAVLLTRHTLDVEIITDQIALKNANVNGDDIISLADAVKLTRYTLDLEDSLG